MFDRVKDVSRMNDKSKYFQLRRILSMDELKLFSKPEINSIYIKNELLTLEKDFNMERYFFGSYFLCIVKFR